MWPWTLFLLNILVLSLSLSTKSLGIPHLFVFIPMTLVSYGFLQICIDKGFPPSWWIVTLGPSWFLMGVILQAKFLGNQRSKIKQSEARNSERSWGWILVVVTVTLLSVYHFAIVGVVTFSSQVEVTRFTSIDGSGLFGIPGRMVIFGLPVLVTVAITQRKRLPRWTVVTSVAIFIFSRLALGFKGGVYEIAITILIALSISSTESGIKMRKTQIMGLGILSLLFGSWLATSYATLSKTSGFSIQYIIDRFTTIPAYPEWLALLNGHALTNGINVLFYDFHYFMQKYLSTNTGVNFAFDQLISSEISGTRRTSDAFLVPVTVGGAGYLLNVVFPYLAIALLVFAGLFFQRTLFSLSKSPSLMKAIVLAAILTAIRVFLSNGEGAYLLINLGVVSILLLGLYLLGQWLAVGTKKSKING